MPAFVRTPQPLPRSQPGRLFSRLGLSPPLVQASVVFLSLLLAIIAVGCHDAHITDMMHADRLLPPEASLFVLHRTTVDSTVQSELTGELSRYLTNRGFLLSPFEEADYYVLVGHGVTQQADGTWVHSALLEACPAHAFKSLSPREFSGYLEASIRLLEGDPDRSFAESHPDVYQVNRDNCIWSFSETNTCGSQISKKSLAFLVRHAARNFRRFLAPGRR